jgi:hypothetical protein
VNGCGFHLGEGLLQKGEIQATIETSVCREYSPAHLAKLVDGGPLWSTAKSRVSAICALVMMGHSVNDSSDSEVTEVYIDLRGGKTLTKNVLFAETPGPINKASRTSKLQANGHI